MEFTETTLTHVASRKQAEPTNHAAFIALYDAYFSRVYNYIRYRSGDADTADDLTAIVFEKALYNFHRYQPGRAPFSAWLFAIARNIVNSHLRQQRCRKTTPFESLPDQPANEALPEASLISSETSGELIAALDTLEERERDILGLQFAARLTNRRITEISAAQHTPFGLFSSSPEATNP